MTTQKKILWMCVPFFLLNLPWVVLPPIMVCLRNSGLPLLPWFGLSEVPRKLTRALTPTYCPFSPSLSSETAALRQAAPPVLSPYRTVVCSACWRWEQLVFSDDSEDFWTLWVAFCVSAIKYTRFLYQISTIWQSIHSLKSRNSLTNNLWLAFRTAVCVDVNEVIVNRRKVFRNSIF